MKKIVLGMIVAVLGMSVAAGSVAQAGQKYGFLSLPFGSTWEQAQAFAAKELGRYLVREDFDRMVISGYTLGAEQVVVSLAFDDNRRFYNLTIRMTAWHDGDELTRRDADFLLNVFNKKYGAKYQLDKSRRSKILYFWSRPDLLVYIGLMNVDVNDGIAAYGSVTDQRMAAAMHRQREKKEGQEAERAAKGF